MNIETLKQVKALLDDIHPITRAEAGVASSLLAEVIEEAQTVVHKGHTIKPYGEYFEVKHPHRRGTSPLFKWIGDAKAYVDTLSTVRGPVKQPWPEVVGTRFVDMDYAPIEVRVMAHHAEDMATRETIAKMIKDALGEDGDVRKYGAAWSWKIDGSIYRLEPQAADKKGRMWRLYQDGEPAFGGQYHYNIESAVRRSVYCAQGSYASRINTLLAQVNTLERALADVNLLDAVKIAMKEVRDYPEEPLLVVGPFRIFELGGKWHLQGNGKVIEAGTLKQARDLASALVLFDYHEPKARRFIELVRPD